MDLEAKFGVIYVKPPSLSVSLAFQTNCMQKQHLVSPAFVPSLPI